MRRHRYGDKPNWRSSSDGQKPEKDMLDEMTLTLSGDTMTITVNDDTIITIDGEDATLDELQVGDTVSFFLDGEISDFIERRYAGVDTAYAGPGAKLS